MIRYTWILLIALTFVLVATGCQNQKSNVIPEKETKEEEGDGTTPPYDFTWSDETVSDRTITFTSNVTDKKLLWDFGDGSTSAELKPAHQYNKKGFYTISLTVDGDTANTVTREIGVGYPIYFGYTGLLLVGEKIVFEPKQSFGTIPEGTKFLWSFGDGQTSEEPAPVHIYKDTGLYNLSLKINNNYNASGYYQIQISGRPVNAENIAGTRTFKFTHIVKGGGYDTTYQLPDQAVNIQYINPLTIHLAKIPGCNAPETDLTYNKKLSSNTVHVYSYQQDYTEMKVYYDYVADTVMIYDRFTYVGPNSSGGVVIYYDNIGRDH
ncbi:MAG: PKD domain-containing protein [Chitinophagaceae bacterium]|nr:PKD domain-containing protein [Chitinophagaceae bacterium]MCB9044549.1 PKD domain-containing protein [Chitinophagales bacterium]